MLRAVDDGNPPSAPSAGAVDRVADAPFRRPLPVRLTAEALGTAALLVGVVGSAIAADRLTADLAVQLAIRAIATGGVVAVAVLVLRPVSSAHLNPAITLVRWAGRRMRGTEAISYTVAQVVGAVVGVVVANVMFNEPAFEWSTTTRSGGQLWLSEAVATRRSRVRGAGAVAAWSSGAHALGGGRLDGRRDPLHALVRLRQPGSDARPHADRVARRDRPILGADVRARAARRRPRRIAVVALLLPRAADQRQP